MSHFSIGILISMISALFFTSGEDAIRGKYSSTKKKNQEWFAHQIELSDSPPANPPYGIGDPTTREPNNPIRLKDPANYRTEYELDDEGEGYEIRERVGNTDISRPSYISADDYRKWRMKNSMRDYWKTKTGESGDENNALKLGIDVNSPFFTDIFRGKSVEIRPTGTALLDFSGNFNRMQNPSLPVRQQRTANFNFDQQIQMNVVGKIGEALQLNANWDTEASFDFENQFKIQYKGTEDQILQSIDAGNVSLPLKGSLIQGSQNIFGVKTALKFGPLLITTVASQQKGKTQSLTIENGAQVTNYEKKIDDYDDNRHFFLAHHWRSRYEKALERLPNINSGYTFTRIEVWITNLNNSSTSNNRNGVGFVDLGEQETMVIDNAIGNQFNPTLGQNNPTILFSLIMERLSFTAG